MKRLLVRAGRPAALFLAAGGFPHAAWGQQYPQYYGHMWNGGWQGWFMGPLMMILFIAIVVALVVLLVRWLGGSGHGGAAHPPPGRTPLDILRERFARGEIDREEFEERRRVLGD